MLIYDNLEYIRIVRPLPNYIKRDAYCIPVIEPDEIDISNLNNGKWLINIKNTSTKDKNACNKIVHMFCYDDQLRRVYNNPIQLLNKIGKYYAVSTPDFTMDSKMDKHQIVDAIYKNRWLGCFLQSHGKKVIPTVGWVKPDTYDICFAGLRDYSTFIISTLSVNNTISQEDFLNGYYMLRKLFPNSQVICIGNKIKGMNDDVCYIKYENSFGNHDQYFKYWQPKLFDWNSIESR